jgi:hypothetical protein
MASVNSATSYPYERFLRGRKFKEILLKCSVISRSRIVTKVPRNPVPFGQFARFERVPGKRLRDEEL